MTPNTKIGALAAIGSLAALAVGIALPAVANDDGHEADPYVERFDENGGIIPEADHPTGDGDVATLERLQDLEKFVDPEGVTSTYVCANPGDREATVVHGYPESDADKRDRKSGEKLGKVEKADNPCANKLMVVGK